MSVNPSLAASNSLLSCRNDIANKAYPQENTRALSGSDVTICGLSCTDFKIYALLITGRLLQVASLVFLAATVITAITAGSFALTGVVQALALGLIGTVLVPNSCSNDPLEMARPFVPGQPVGLKNYYNDCWLNSSLQLLANAPAFQARMRQIPVFSQFLDNYAIAQDGLNKVATHIDTHQIRRVLSAQTRGQISPNNEQEDVAEFFAHFFAHQELYAMELREDGGRPRSHSESLITLALGANAAQRPNFEKLLAEYFNYQNPNGKHVQLSFKEVPSDLLIQFKRFVNVQDAQGRNHFLKVNDPFNVPSQFTMQLDLHTKNGMTKKEATYEPRAFLVHSGKTIGIGHYTAFVKKGQSWWFLNDRIVYEVPESTAMAWLPYSYILHCSEVPIASQSVPDLNANPQQLP